MVTHVIILAQGRQERMGKAVGPKQLLPLPACGNQPILGRTLRQLAIVAPPHSIVTIIAWHEIDAALFPGRRWGTTMSIGSNNVEGEVVNLLDPGNSSLKGIYRYLQSQALIAEARSVRSGSPNPDRTIVLLGDVVYSWRCLEALVPNTGAIGFVGTSDISPSGGELWGVAWERKQDGVMMEALKRALDKHPPFDATYQPGQLRRWMWAVHPAYQTTPLYCAIDDYTMDVDVPEHLAKLDGVSRIAAEDDALHGITW